MSDFLESEEFYNAMKQYRFARVGDLRAVAERFEEVKSMVRTELVQQAAVIEQMREALEISSVAVKLAGWEGDFAYTNAMKARDLQPCTEVLNKVRAAAVRKAAHKAWMVASSDCELRVRRAVMLLADRMEQGEA